MIGSCSLLFYKKYYNTFNNEEHDEMGFAERVKNVRIELKLSQEDLAHKLGVDFATINKWENDSYSKHLFFSIEKAERLNARL